MSDIVYRIAILVAKILDRVPVGTNLGLFHLLFALLSGRFLQSRGAVFPALADMGLTDRAVRRSEAALAQGKWQIATLLAAWQILLRQEGRVQPRSYGGYRPVSCDLVGFFRPHLSENAGKHYTSQAGKALPAVVFGLSASVGSVGKSRLPVARLILRQEAADGGEPGLQRRLIERTARELAANEAIVVDAGFSLEHLLSLANNRFVVRVRTNFTARRNFLPVYKGKGARPRRGELVRPLARKYARRTLAATQEDRSLIWYHQGRRIEAKIFEHLVLKAAKLDAPSFTCVVILDPRYKEPLVLVSNLAATARTLWELYRDRWPIEQMPLAAKQMLGAARAFVFGAESRYRLPELALLAGNLLSYVAATSQPVASGFWDRCARPTCGRIRRALARVNCADLPMPQEKLRRKESITAHLPKGVRAHRRRKALPKPPSVQKTAA
jgi:hypothetical protein